MPGLEKHWWPCRHSMSYGQLLVGQPATSCEGAMLHTAHMAPSEAPLAEVGCCCMTNISADAFVDLPAYSTLVKTSS